MKQRPENENFALSWQEPATLRVEGAIDFDNTPAILARSEPMLREGFTRFEAVTIDMGAVQSARSPGIALMLEWKRFAAGHQKKLTFSHTPESLVRLAEISELNTILELQSSRDPAKK